MAAAEKLLQTPQPRNSSKTTVPIIPRNAVATLFGYGIVVRVDRGHLILQDGIGKDRREARLPRVGHGLRRLVVVGNDGSVSLAALRWLADQNASFAMLDRDGSVLVTTGPVRPSDVRLRRAQALAQNTDQAVHISRHLIEHKLLGQEQVARTKLQASSVADAIARWRANLAGAASINDVRFIESQAAGLYWSAFRDLPIRFPKQQLPRVPQHWLTFGTRQSPITKSPRLAVNPTNAILNYLYAIVEAECRLAAAALGLDPGLGFLHLDTVARDSLACDLMEPVRPKVDAYLVDLVTRQPLARDWFFEVGNGNCRLMPGIVSALSETSTQWAKHIAPFAEWLTRTLWSAKGKTAEQKTPPTRLTQSNKYTVKGATPPSVAAPVAKTERVCATCGIRPALKGNNCPDCARELYREEMIDIAKRGRVLANTPEANAKRVEKQAKQWAARWAWKPEDQPAWLTTTFYATAIQPRLAVVEVPKIAAALGVSEAYAADIRAGRNRPHPRHWDALATLAGLSTDRRV
jgi:CRISPR-associated endonuclease Cas1